MKYLKLIWDFKGPDAHLTANHHLIHLKEYVSLHEISSPESGIEDLSASHTYAFVVVNETDMPQLRDQLKPHRGKLWTATTD